MTSAPRGRDPASAAAVRLHVPGAVARSDETIFSGRDGGIAENLGVDCRIDAAQAARQDRPAALTTRVDVVPPGERRGGAKRGDDRNKRGDDRKCQDTLFAVHRKSPHLKRLDRNLAPAEPQARSGTRNARLRPAIAAGIGPEPGRPSINRIIYNR